MHTPIYLRNVEQDGHHQPGRCRVFLTTHRWCQNNAVEGETICGVHVRKREANALAEQEQRAQEAHIQAFVDTFFAMNPRPTWREATRIVFQQQAEIRQRTGFPIVYEIVMRYYARVGETDARRLDLYWLWLRQGQQGPDPTLPRPLTPPPPPPPVQELARIATDTQSVHTAPVSRQTNAGTEKLLTTQVPSDQQTEKALMRAWLAMPGPQPGWNEILRVATDVNKWFNTPTCRAHNDNLYRKLLRGLVAIINRTDDETRPELFKRAWEECKEATGMCCEGHISRVCNVLVGFDEAFQPQVSLGELMQQKMAAIAGLEVSEEEKRRQATAWFDEHAVPQDERTAWLDAF